MLRADLKFCDKKAVDRYEHCCLVYRVFVERKDISWKTLFVKKNEFVGTKFRFVRGGLWMHAYGILFLYDRHSKVSSSPKCKQSDLSKMNL